MSETYTTEQLHAAIEKARLEERTKLQADLTAATTNAETTNAKVAELNGKLSETLTALQTAEAERLRLDGALKAIEKSKTADGAAVDVTKLVEEVTAAAETRLSEQFKAKHEEQTLALNSLRQQLTLAELDKARAKLIADAGGPERLVMELVGGDTVEALTASIGRAKDAFATIESRVGKTSSRSPNSPPPVSPAGSGAPGVGSGDGVLLPRVRELGVKDYAANRDAILAQAKARLTSGT